MKFCWINNFGAMQPAQSYYNKVSVLSNERRMLFICYLRARNSSLDNTIRDGSEHGIKEVVSYPTATDMPSFSQIPATMQERIDALSREKARMERERINEYQELNRQADRLILPSVIQKPVRTWVRW